MQIRIHRSRAKRRGSVLVMALLVAIMISGMAAATLVVNSAANQEHREAGRRLEALYVAEAGLSRAIVGLNNGQTASFGNSKTPLGFSGGGSYWGTVGDNGDGTFTIASFADVAGKARGVEAVLVQASSPIYDNALFAGNVSGDPLYSLGLGGLGGQADFVDGSIYSGGDIDIQGDASVTGALKAAGTINGGTGDAGKEAIPDIPAMQYATNNDYDVAAMFGAATYQSDNAGGSAYQLPESSPAHIFRLNPSDRSTNTSSTQKDDYFLEDPYEPVRVDSGSDGSDAFPITLSGVGGESGPDSNQKIFYIDGNLWIHNKKTYSMKFNTEAGTGMQISFVVSGNIYFSDNVFYEDPDTDGVAFIAIKDPLEADSGNIYFGDPSFGTLEYMDAFMYAENNFYDNNLDASGSAQVTVNGNMTAGNQVLINRDYGNQHSKLTVLWDDRISNLGLTLPGLPTKTSKFGTYSVSSWREIPVP